MPMIPFVPRPSVGFTLVEVLIAVLVMGIGLLGLAGLQTTGLRGTLGAAQRSEATRLAYEIADRMRANPAGVAAGAYDNQAGTGDDCLHGACSPTQLAGYDLAQWLATLGARLPAGAGWVCLDSTPDDGAATAPDCDGDGSAYAIKIWWDESRTGDPARFQRFATSVQP